MHLHGRTEDGDAASDVAHGHQLLFLGGLHRSGTTLLARLLRGHPSISGFQGTGAKEDEGQHLQSVYPPANAFGGEGRFGFDPAAHLCERSPEVARWEAAALFRAWSPFWDLDRPVLVEKSPPNVIRSRYLQSLFPSASFVMILRHPVEVVLAQRKRARSQTLASLFRHWFRCHDILSADAPHVTRIAAIRYEHLVAAPQATLDEVVRFVGLQPAPEASAGEVSDAARARYAAMWHDLSTRWPRKAHVASITRRFEPDANRYGYSLRDLDVTGPWSLPR